MGLPSLFVPKSSELTVALHQSTRRCRRNIAASLRAAATETQIIKRLTRSAKVRNNWLCCSDAGRRRCGRGRRGNRRGEWARRAGEVTAARELCYAQPSGPGRAISDRRAGRPAAASWAGNCVDARRSRHHDRDRRRRDADLHPPFGLRRGQPLLRVHRRPDRPRARRRGGRAHQPAAGDRGRVGRPQALVPRAGERVPPGQGRGAGGELRGGAAPLAVAARR